jgi:anti-anti-sigma factor
MGKRRALDARRVVLRGVLDYATEFETRCALTEAVESDARVVVVDCGDVTFIDSCGLRALLVARVTLTAEGRRFRIEDPSIATRRVVEMAGLAKFLGLH